MDKLIIAEKPSVALRIALSLGEERPKTEVFNGIRYYEITRKGERIYIVAAAGHLFTLHQKVKSHDLPIFEIEWIPSYKVNKKAYFTKKYLDAIQSVGSKCGFFINACDYDLEGTVIGSNLIKDILNKDPNMSIQDTTKIGRMKFSTTTKPDLEYAYDNLSKFDIDNLHAGEARHMLDWMWGINMSRVLMNSLFMAGVKKVMSVGRVQGPALGILAKRELEIKNFKPQPFWTVHILYRGIDFDNKKGNIFEKKEAEKIFETTKKAEVAVKEVSVQEETRYPFPPFDLTSLQLEASRVARMDPTRTLAIAQSLYERSYISYPRTSSQKLPPTLNLKRVISLMAQNEKYTEMAQKLMKESRFRPREGIKEDEAHPAIYPTGELPKKMTDEEEAIYDIIAKRFLACFAEPASLEKVAITLSAGTEEYAASGSIVKNKGWMEFYNYYKTDERAMPKLEVGEHVKPEKVDMNEGKTEPPKRYTKASLIALLEKKDLGTKATRAAIIDTLFSRGYIVNSRIEVTDFGTSVFNTLSKYSGEILDEEMTKRLEKDMEKIAKGTMKESEVIDEGKKIITEIVGDFKKNGKEIGVELSKGLEESELANSLGKCNKCGKGLLVIKRSRNNKQFVGCSAWPECDNSYPLPQYAKIVPLHKICEECGAPRIKVFAKGKVYEMCVNPICPSKKDWGKKKEEEKKVGETVVAPQKEAKVKEKAAKPKKEKGASAKKKVARKKKKGEDPVHIPGNI